MIDQAYIAVATAIFAFVAIQFLFPCNTFIPLDRRTSSVLGGLLCYITRRFIFPSESMDVLNSVDFDVMVLLSSIMIINHIVVHLRETRDVIEYMQQSVTRNPIRALWLVSFAAFVASPFLTNDGVCLLFVEPILNAFEHAPAAGILSASELIEANVNDGKGKFPLLKEDALYFLLALACSANIGSALTYTGNPQNMIVSSDSIHVMPSYKFFAYMFPASVGSWLITMGWIRHSWMTARASLETAATHMLASEVTQPLHVPSEDSITATSDPSQPPLQVDTLAPLQNPAEMQASSPNSQPRPSFWSLSIFGGTGGAGAGAGIGGAKKMGRSPSSAAALTLSPRRRQAQERGRAMKRVVRLVTSPFPYVVLILLGIMIIMIFVDVMPISGLICVFAIVMVVTVVLGNHWRDRQIWVEEELEPGAPPTSSSSSAAAAAAAAAAARTTSSSSMSKVNVNKERLFDNKADIIGEATSGGSDRDRLVLSPPADEESKGEDYSTTADSSSTRVAAAASIAKEADANAQVGTVAVDAAGLDQMGKEEVSYTLSAAAQQQNPEEDLGPLTREDKLDNLNQFFEALFNSIDYSLLIIFLGLFIVVENMDSTGIPRRIWNKIVGDVPFDSFTSIVGISAFVLICSQFLGNVAVIQLAKPNVEPLDDDHKRLAWAVISFVATVGGNLLITGSAANIIVAEKAARLDATMAIDFFRHYRVCFWITLFCCVAGGALITGIVEADNASGSNW